MINNIKNIKDQNFLENVEKFGKVVESDRLYENIQIKNDCIANIKFCEVSLIEGRKYIKVLIGTSTVFFIDKVNGDIYGIKDNKTINKKYYYGTIFNCEARWWGFYCNTNKNYTRDMHNLLTVDGVVKEMEEAEQVTKVIPAKEEKEEVNSLCTVKFTKNNIIITLKDDLIKQSEKMQHRLRLLIYNGFKYDFENKMFFADNNDFMINLLIKLEFINSKLKSVKKRNSKDFEVKEKETNKNIEKTNLENKSIEQKDDKIKTKNAIFVNFNKHSKNKNDSVAPEEKEPIKITINTENHGNEVFDNWKAATSLYNGIVNFLQYHNEDDREDIFYITVKQGNKEYYKKFYVNDKIDIINNLKDFLIKDIYSDIEFFKTDRVGKEYIDKINPKHLEDLKKELLFLSNF